MTIKEQNESLTRWVIDKIRRDYPDDVALLIGCSALRMPEDQSQLLFDYFVPATKRGNELARTFIVNGKGYDLYPRSWERLAGMARLEDENNTCLACTEVLYARSEEDRQRFEALRQEFFQNLKDPVFTRHKALERLRNAMEIHQSMLFESAPSRIRMAAGYAANYLSMAVAFTNGRFFRTSQIYQTEELADMPLLPENFPELYEQLFLQKEPDRLRELIRQMILSVRRFLEAQVPGSPADPADLQGLAFWYQELIYTWRRIDLAVGQKDFKRAFVWGCYLQQELDTVCSEFALPPLPLMDAYDPADLAPLQQRARELEQVIRGTLAQHGILLDEYTSAEDFLQKNS
ncbi:MAG: hypothetical protein PUC47_07875 [Oscillospiraceae bacterium]|nr:hypothetical protein [Oscillospiraceae bacterium]